jgi:hypothetical protein
MVTTIPKVEATVITLTITRVMGTRVTKGTRAIMDTRRAIKAIMTRLDTKAITVNMVDTRNLIMTEEVIMGNTIRVKRGRKGTSMANTGALRRDTQQRERTRFTNSTSTRSIKTSTTNTMMRDTMANMADTIMNMAPRREDTIRAAITSPDIRMTTTVRKDITRRDITLTNTRATKVRVATIPITDTIRTIARREVMMTIRNGATAMDMVGMVIIVKLSHFLLSYGLLFNCMLCLLCLSGGSRSHK